MMMIYLEAHLPSANTHRSSIVQTCVPRGPRGTPPIEPHATHLIYLSSTKVLAAMWYCRYQVPPHRGEAGAYGFTIAIPLRHPKFYGS